MNQFLIALIIQVILTIPFVWIAAKNDKKYYYIMIYLMAVLLDFSFETILYNLLQKDLTLMLAVPPSFRLVKGPLLLLFTFQCLGKKVNPFLYTVIFLPFLFFFLLNMFVFYGIFNQTTVFQQLTVFYQAAFQYYIHYWLGFVLLSIVLILRSARPWAVELKYVLLFLSFLFITISGFYKAPGLFNISGTNTWKIYTYAFFIQFALIIFMSLHSILNAKKKVAAEKYHKTKLQQNDYDQILEKLQLTLKEKKLYRKEDLSLEDVAKEIKVSRHHLTESLSIGLKTNFYEYINLFRIEEVAVLINKDPNQSITDIFYSTGFKSKSTFYKYFRQKFGMNPNEFRKQNTKTTA